MLYLRRKRAWKKKWVEEDLRRREGEEESMIRGLEKAQVCHFPTYTVSRGGVVGRGVCHGCVVCHEKVFTCVFHMCFTGFSRRGTEDSARQDAHSS